MRRCEVKIHIGLICTRICFFASYTYAWYRLRRIA